MKIGIIGAGHVGTVLATHLTALGHQVVIANSRGPASLKDISVKTGAAAVEVREVARDQDMVIVTITEKGVSKLPHDLFQDVLADVVVIDTCNYYPDRDGALPKSIPVSPTANGCRSS